MKNILARTTPFLLMLCVASSAFAQTYKPLSRQLPLIDENTWTSFPELLNALLGISVGIASVLAVVMLAVGGFKYMTTDSVFALGNAREQIANAIIGLIVVLTAILVLRTINPEIVSLSFFGKSN